MRNDALGVLEDLKLRQTAVAVGIVLVEELLLQGERWTSKSEPSAAAPRVPSCMRLVRATAAS